MRCAHLILTNYNTIVTESHHDYVGEYGSDVFGVTHLFLDSERFHRITDETVEIDPSSIAKVKPPPMIKVEPLHECDFCDRITATRTMTKMGKESYLCPMHRKLYGV